MTTTKPQQGTTTKIYFIVLMLFILAGTIFWTLLTIWGAEPLGPTTAKDFAQAFERECFLELQDQDECRKLVGQNHRDCLFDNIEEVEPGSGDEGGDIKHDREGYLACMREATGVSH